MYILHLDESGLHAEASHFVLAGLAVFEREIHWFGQDLDALQELYLPDQTEPVHFHASRLRVREGAMPEPPWDKLTGRQRRELKGRIYDIIRERRGVLFGCAIQKQWAEARGVDPYARAFEELVSRFDLFMSRLNRAATTAGEGEQRGLLVLAESSYRKTLGILARQLQSTGTRWGTSLHNITGTPLFAPAAENPLAPIGGFLLQRYLWTLPRRACRRLRPHRCEVRLRQRSPPWAVAQDYRRQLWLSGLFLSPNAAIRARRLAPTPYAGREQ